MNKLTGWQGDTGLVYSVKFTSSCTKCLCIKQVSFPWNTSEKKTYTQQTQKDWEVKITPPCLHDSYKSMKKSIGYLFFF